MLPDNFEENISSKALNNGKKKIRLVDISNSKENIKQTDIDKKKLAIPNWKPQNKLPSDLFLIFEEVTFSKSKFLASTPISDTQYEHSES